MPDSFGKRQRREVKAKAAAAREERRIARNRRRENRAAGIVDEPSLGAPLDGPNHDWAREAELHGAGDADDAAVERAGPDDA
jgi:hypothetical protein